ncbi:phosphopantetheine-binding protein, partial [Paenibacillus sp. 598K]|uniref:phosphopantetheine-binding protein n=1 Tax=Paenibacillus sp. 598K TaxID=1117987 RepID=UPI001C88B335
ALFDSETAARMVRDYVALLRQIAAAPQRPLAELAAAAGIALREAAEPSEPSEASQQSEADEEPGVSDSEAWAPMERLLADVWSELLGRERVGRADDFFGIGGHSLRALVLTAQLHQQYGLPLG